MKWTAINRWTQEILEVDGEYGDDIKESLRLIGWELRPGPGDDPQSERVDHETSVPVSQ